MFPHKHGVLLEFALAVDPFQPFLDDKKYSSTPFLAVPMSAPAHLRWSLAHTLCIVPGTTEEKKKVGSARLSSKLLPRGLCTMLPCVLTVGEIIVIVWCSMV